MWCLRAPGTTSFAVEEASQLCAAYHVRQSKTSRSLVSYSIIFSDYTLIQMKPKKRPEGN